MTGFTPTADLYDRYGEELECCETQFRPFGRKLRFQGEIVTVRSYEDNVLLRELINQSGRGRVIVVDAGGSLHCAMLGDVAAQLALDNGWEGIIIYGAIRDAAAIDKIDIGVKALGVNPRKPRKYGAGETNAVISFGGAVFTPGAFLVSDEDGVVALPGRARTTLDQGALTSEREVRGRTSSRPAGTMPGGG